MPRVEEWSCSRGPGVAGPAAGLNGLGNDPDRFGIGSSRYPAAVLVISLVVVCGLVLGRRNGGPNRGTSAARRPAMPLVGACAVGALWLSTVGALGLSTVAAMASIVVTRVVHRPSLPCRWSPRCRALRMLGPNSDEVPRPSPLQSPSSTCLVRAWSGRCRRGRRIAPSLSPPPGRTRVRHSIAGQAHTMSTKGAGDDRHESEPRPCPHPLVP